MSSPHDFTHRGLLDSLHLWLHRAGGDEALALACRLFDWSTLPSLILSPPERAALDTLLLWHSGTAVDLIDACADFHEQCLDCLTVGRRAEAIDTPHPQRRMPGTTEGTVLDIQALACLRQWGAVFAYLQGYGHHLHEVEVGVWQLRFVLGYRAATGKYQIERWLAWDAARGAVAPSVWQEPIDAAARELGIAPVPR